MTHREEPYSVWVPQGSDAENLFPNAAVFRGGALGKWLDHQGSQSMN